jgi:hypothetical protein
MFYFQVEMKFVKQGLVNREIALASVIPQIQLN